ncbi:hypothetical protein, conserved [Babesia ovata]|uniref:C3H1-type domain-containing protein n=1 Tax=Babesia ovata TaxID=189622 RepID=A0A2H6KJK7_9APIC|nr:uncharacterized protein BOVATA_046530 [Babesia ovata]GBE63160.1 hypothetical protein, conserved [Babesia ovata]
MVSLAELSGKLGQFIGQSDAVTKAINNGITAIIDSDEVFKSLKMSPSSPVQSSTSVSAVSIDDDKLSKEIQHYEALKKRLKPKIEELKKQKMSVPDDLNKSHESLTSKLDALQKLKSLNESLSSLNNQQSDNCKNLLTNLCSGLEKFLGYQETSKGYDGSGIVYSDLDRLCDGVMAFLHGVLNDVHKNNNLSPYKEKLDKAVEALDGQLNNGKTGLHDVIDRVKEGIERWLGDVKLKNEHVTGHLLQIENNYIPAITTDIRNLIDHNYDDKKVDLKSWLKSLPTLKTYCNLSVRALEALDQNLKKELSPHVSLIKDRVDTFVDSTKQDHDGLKKVCERVDEEFGKLDEMVEKGLKNPQNGLIKKFRDGISGILQKIQVARNGSVKTSIEKGKQSLMKAKIESNNGFTNEKNGVKQRIITAFENIKQELESVHGNLTEKKRELTDLVRQAEEPFIQMKYLGGDKIREGFIEYHWKELKEETWHLVRKVNGDEKSGLLQIYQGVQGYAKDFPNRFKLAIETMIKKMLEENNSAVDQYIGWYVDDTTNDGLLSGGTRTEKINNVKKAINDCLKIVIPQLVDECSKAPHIQGSNVTNIASNFSSFAKQLEEKLTGKNVDPILSAIEGAVVKQSQGPQKTNNHDLTTALKTMFTTVTKVAAGTASELAKLINDSHMGNVHDALDRFRSFNSKYNDPSKPAHRISHALNSVKGEINKLGELLDTTTGTLKSKIRTLSEVSEKLNNLKKESTEKGTIDTKKNEITQQLTLLRQNIDNDFQAVIDILIHSQLQLDTLLDQLKKALEDFQDRFLQEIESFHQAYKKQSTTAATSIKRQALSQFAASKAHALQKLKELVEEQKDLIENKIYIDSRTGLKGFMKIFNEKLVDKLEEINKIDSTSSAKETYPLSKAVEHFNAGLGNVFYQFEEQRKEFDAWPPELLSSHTTLPEPSKYEKVYEALKAVLQDLHYSKHFDHNFSDHLKSLNTALSTFSPAKFTDSSSPILQALKDGIGALAKQLGYAYVSTYCCRKFDGALLDPQDPTTSDDKRKLTDYGKKLSKVFLTCLPGWVTDMYSLQRNCSGEWSKKQINTPTKENMVALWFHSRGFTVPEDDKKQNGHLKRGMTGEQIKTKLVEHKLDASKIKIKIKNSNNQITLIDILNLCHYFLEKYNRVSHYYIPPKPRAPSNIYNMLQWTAGLKYNHMYGEVKSQLGSVLKGLQKEHKLEKTELPVAVPYDMQRVIQSPINSAQLTNALDNVCYFAGETLVAVLGHGHADGSGGACLDMLVDVLFRLYQQLWFLCRQCLGDKSHSGWKDCSYGRYVSGSGWQCNDKQCPNQECKLSANQKVNQNPDQTLKQTADQRCDQHPDCGMKSPLQSFLEDGLQGFLPHSFSSPGCKITCTVSNHRGLPCKTPMGFADIGVVASHTKTGEYLKDALNNFCGPYSALTRLCNMLNCVLRRAPQTLDDIFGFLRGYLANWIDHGREHKCLAFSKAIKDAYFGQEYSDLTPTILFTTRVHQSGNKSNHSEGDLFTISECEDRAVDTCGVYVESLSYNLYSIFSSYHNKQYLSWILYSAETLYSLLDRLYKQCCNNCTSPGAKCHGTRCADKCQVKQAYDAQTSDDADGDQKKLNGKNHTENCSSIVRCQNTLPTLYMYGFSFGKPLGLCGTGDALEARRTCKDFCSALKKILEEESALIQLIKQIDEFIWKIRENFSYTLLALWSLSLLYLLHITVVRLDVLRIRSHLKSPSSHRIAAQSLLAAARVKALANVKYFSP